LLIASSFIFHLFFPFHYGWYGPWHPFFFFGGFFLFKAIFIIALIFFIGRRIFWGPRWAYGGWGYRGDYRGHGHPCNDYRGDRFQGNEGRGWRAAGAGQFRGRWHGRASFEQAGNRNSADFIEYVSGFGKAEKKISSKNFQGGDVTTIMGQLVVDLRDADFAGTVRLKVTQIQGVTTIVVPKEWDVQAGVGTVFGTYKDDQAARTTVNPDKVLVIDGTCVMGGIDVRTN